ncbi:Hypp4336 [Branchiostoma lanceolatum]|uniref:Hypp4336 protein n=1 Tax=Branchiostoma lanceolatum TaxID=7740 RepID=A0A8K0EVJ4_BRALA|nr:Hypp4336 [Branchiostoma lanceolatum]
MTTTPSHLPAVCGGEVQLFVLSLPLAMTAHVSRQYPRESSLVSVSISALTCMNRWMRGETDYRRADEPTQLAER